jgi:hypothetical protein
LATGGDGLAGAGALAGLLKEAGSYLVGDLAGGSELKLKFAGDLAGGCCCPKFPGDLAGGCCSKFPGDLAGG